MELYQVLRFDRMRYLYPESVDCQRDEFVGK